jgi:hypothetical protein
METKSDPDQNSVKPTTLSLRELAVLAPIVASAVAVSYDVGYFVSFDVSYFSFFSLSEHIVFALQALPWALILVAGVYGLTLVTMSAFRHHRPRKNITSGRKLRRTWKSWLIAAGLLLSVSIAFGEIGLVSLAYSALAGALIVLVVFWDERRGWLIAVPLMLLISYGAGRDMANNKRYQPHQTHLVTKSTGDVVEGTLIRSGEGGILFYFAASKEVGVMRWNSINEITTKTKKPLQPPWIFR